MVTAFDTLAGSFGDMTGRVFDACEQGFNLAGKGEVADTFGAAGLALSVIDAASDLAHLPGSVSKCISVAKEQGFSFKLLNTGRKLVANICSLSVNIGNVLKLVRVAVSVRIAPFLPWGDALLSVNDVYCNIRKICKKQGASWNPEKAKAFKLKVTLNVWELCKNIVLLASGVLAIVGLALSGGVLFAISVTALVLTTITFFAKQKHNDCVMKHGTKKLLTK